MPPTRQKSPIRGNTDFDYDLAIRQRNRRRLKTLLKYQIKPPKTCLIYAYELGHKDLLPLLLEAGADPNYIGHRGWTVMGDCILNSDIPVLKLLLERGADPNRGFAGEPAIVNAARVGDVEVLRLLIETGANLFDDPRVGPTALFEAIGRGHAETVRYLLEQGVSRTTKKPFGKTAVEYAAEKGSSEIQQLLLSSRSRNAKRRT